MKPTSSTMLMLFAAISEDAPLEMLTEAGSEFQKAGVALFRHAAAAGSDPNLVIQDVIAIASRLIVTANLAGHSNKICDVCHRNLVRTMISTLDDEQKAHAISRKEAH